MQSGLFATARNFAPVAADSPALYNILCRLCEIRIGRRRGVCLPFGKWAANMIICGLQKLTLLDYPGKVACTVFTGGCNLRCPFCHNAPLVLESEPEEAVTHDEFFAYLKKRQGVLDGVCVSGGEPLLQADLPQFIKQIRAFGYLIKLDTNGCFPQRLRAIVAEGLVDYVAMDIKNSPERYAETVGIPGFSVEPIRQSIAFLMSEPVDYEFRTTVVRGLHTRQSIRETARAIAGAKRYFLQKFVDSGDLVGDAQKFSAFTDDEMREFRNIALPFVPSAALRGVD